MKGLAVAAAIGAGTAAFFYGCMTLGLRAGFAAADYMARRRMTALERNVT